MEKSQIDLNSMRTKVEEVAKFLNVLSNPNRLLVLCHLSTGAHYVSDLERVVDISQSALSQHLAKLRDEGIVEAKKEGLQVSYYIVDENIKKLLPALYDMFCA